MLTNAVGEPLGPHLDEVMQLLFSQGLSENLRELVEQIAENIPFLTARVQRKYTAFLCHFMTQITRYVT
jgi:hypothetical protein